MDTEGWSAKIVSPLSTQSSLFVIGSSPGRVLMWDLIFSAEVTKMHRQNDTKAWLVRPLPWKLLCYAAADIYLIALLYEDFSAKGWLPLGSKFFGRCNRYVTMHEQFGRIRKETGCFRSGPFIPFGILNGGEPKNCWKTTCNSCGRNMTLFAFETDGHGSRRKVCRLCWLLAEKYSVSCDSRWVQISISL